MLIDKTAFIAGVLDSGYTATLFCRPRCFGKTLNMTIMKAYFEAPPAGLADPGLFEGPIFGRWAAAPTGSTSPRTPVIYLSMRTAKGDTWEQAYGALKDMLAVEFSRHSYLFESSALPDRDEAAVIALAFGTPLESDYAGSLLYLARLLRAHHGRHVVLLIDEHDASVMAGYSARAAVAVVRM